MSHDAANDAPVFCHRCGVQLIEGAGSTYIVRIEAFADPAGPVISAEEMDQDIDYKKAGYMFLASTEETATALRRNVDLNLLLFPHPFGQRPFYSL